MRGVSIYLIVGIDPGIKTAFCALNLKGTIVAEESKKEMGEDKIIRKIMEIGNPSLVATDVFPPPSFVSKVAARFNVRVFYPKKNLKLLHKKAVSPGLKDPHIRDARAAALKAFHFYENRLRQIEGMKHPEADLLKHMVIQGFQLKSALISLQKKQEEKPSPKTKKKKSLKKDNERVLELEEENASLRKYINQLKIRVLNLEKELKKTRSSVHREILREKEIRKLKRKRSQH
ncbi:DUF460 domain-containing protein [Candidatus Micrarchaeota archaeon]|nr:DUF460 domain-containing protein [Candidatus Micrarchaeota archaeon]